jgi:hypothetical protein
MVCGYVLDETLKAAAPVHAVRDGRAVGAPRDRAVSKSSGFLMGQAVA